jgi:hypothetical protein
MYNIYLWKENLFWKYRLKMKPYYFKFLFFFLFLSQFSLAQENRNADILKTILEKYYKTEKPVYKGRSQLLYLYCTQSNNNEEIFEVVKNRKLPDDFMKEVRNSVKTDVAEKDWSKELETIFETDETNLKAKINKCLSVDEYHTISRRLNLNNQRLMIISKPLYYSKSNIALVKVVFYRNIEHNSGSVLLLEKVDNNWIIKEYLNEWST